MIVVSDTSPLCYLLLINQIDILPALYEAVTIPQTVADELRAPASPTIVQAWIAQPPQWLQIQPDPALSAMNLGNLDPGEQAAILLTEQLNADLVILDDKAARQIALERGLRIIGLLGIVKDAARANLLELATTFQQLRSAGFWVAPSLIEQLLNDANG